MKEPYDLIGLGIDSCQVGAFAQIAAVACQCQVVRIVRAAVLLCNDVLDVMRELAVLLVQATIFTPLVGPTADEVTRWHIHRY